MSKKLPKTKRSGSYPQKNVDNLFLSMEMEKNYENNHGFGK